MLYQWPVCNCLHVVKSAFCHQHTSCLAKSIYLIVDTVTDTLNVYNVIQYARSKHNARKVLQHQQLQNVFIFNILTDFTLLLLVCLKFFYKKCGTKTFYIKQHENLLCFLFDSFLTCNVLILPGAFPWGISP